MTPNSEIHPDAVVTSVLQQMIISRVLMVAAEQNVRVILLKGTALAYWLYPAPHMRECQDVDVLVPSYEDAQKLGQALAAQYGGRLRNPWGRMAYERLCLLPITATYAVEVDVHWGLVNSPLYAKAFTFDELWSSTQTLRVIAGEGRGLMPVYALLHACLHRAMNLMVNVSDQRKWFEDIVRLCSVLSTQEWQEFVRLARSKGYAGLCADALRDSNRENEQCAAGLIQAVRDLATDQSSDVLDASRLGDWWYVQWCTMRSWPTHRQRLSWLWGMLFPSKDYLRTRYALEDAAYGVLWSRRVREGLKKACGRRVL